MAENFDFEELDEERKEWLLKSRIENRIEEWGMDFFYKLLGKASILADRQGKEKILTALEREYQLYSMTHRSGRPSKVNKYFFRWKDREEYLGFREETTEDDPDWCWDVDDLMEEAKEELSRTSFWRLRKKIERAKD